MTRTVMSNAQHSTYVSIENCCVVPRCITRFDSGTRVQVRKVSDGRFAVKALAPHPLSVFDEEAWEMAL